MDNAYLMFSARGREAEEKEKFEEVKELYDVKPDECPICHKHHIVRNGHIKSNGRGRYLCKDCGHVFCGSQNTIYFRARVGQHTRQKFVRSLFLGITVRASAKYAHVSVNTVRRCRRLLLERIQKISKKPLLKGSFVQIDETYATLSGRVANQRKLRGISH